MESAGLSPRRLALKVGVSGKTVERWVSDADLIPHPRNREDTCRALGVDEEMIWPKAVKERIKTGGDREILHSYPYRSACPSSVWADLTSEAAEDLFFAGYTNYFLWTQVPDFAGILRRKVQQGCRVRFLLGNPDGEVTRLREEIEGVTLTVSTRIRMTLEGLERLGDQEGLETRFSAAEDAMNHVSLSVFRFDSEALVTPHLARLVGHDSPLLHLRSMGPGGMFARFHEHSEELWSRGVSVA
ncbi:XRE family transcriptional regulator [Streptomyces zhihengii]|uniref:Helix-turn-helix domain-containing protein n=1 Tax=Streptomyces zhihengii TaxID=1818004 RepID=A0ABS2UXU8_9ACTN|nr:helix-turn-helix domain-containing protein [Streptomyces zhihengii]MBM9621525.1 helix-turn-helix domain-containing protein [Streptomyces zhihengii]